MVKKGNLCLSKGKSGNSKSNNYVATMVLFQRYGEALNFIVITDVNKVLC